MRQYIAETNPYLIVFFFTSQLRPTHSRYSRRIWILFQSWYAISMKTTWFRRIRGDVSKHSQHNHVFNLCEDYFYFLPDFYSLCIQHVLCIADFPYDLLETLYGAKTYVTSRMLEATYVSKVCQLYRLIEQSRSLAKDL